MSPSPEKGDDVCLRDTPTWWAEGFWGRVDRCRRMLYAHGLLTDYEHGLLLTRIERAKDEETAKATDTYDAEDA